jgi:hypothetical protein
MKRYEKPRNDIKKVLEIMPERPPYFFLNDDWIYYDDDYECHIREDAPPKAKESFRLYKEGYYDPVEKANVYGTVPDELQLSQEEYDRLIARRLKKWEMGET